MKLSEIKGDRVFEVIADIMEPLANIAGDDDVMAIFTDKSKAEDETGVQFALRKAKTSVPVLLRDHKDDVVEILAVLNGVDKDEYLENVTIPKLIGEVFEVLTDNELLAFLSQSGTTRA